ncbi:MAG: restriction endonuclease subunit S, partial [Methylobacter sp.]|nr:restriction endonuclease subunit S [Methylobacter sp.]
MSWPLVALGDIAPAKPIKLNGYTPSDRIWHVTLDQIESNTGLLLEKSIKPLSEAGSSTHAFDDRHVLYSKLRPYLNKVLLPDETGLGTTELVPMLPASGKLDRVYLAHYLKSKTFVNWISSQTAGAKMPRVSMNTFWEHEIPLPPLAEQKRIAAILDKANSLRRKNQHAIQLADQFLRAVFLELFGDPVTNPKGWNIKPLGEMVRNLDGRRIPVKASDRAVTNAKYRYYGASGIIDYVDDYIFDERTLLIGEDGANLLARSTSIAFIVEGKYWVNNHAHVLAEKGNFPLEYLMYSINMRSIAPYVTGSAQPKLNQEMLNKIPIQIP